MRQVLPGVVMYARLPSNAGPDPFRTDPMEHGSDTGHEPDRRVSLLAKEVESGALRLGESADRHALPGCADGEQDFGNRGPN